jgi:hypothetical protein
MGQKATFHRGKRHVRFPPRSRHRNLPPSCQLWATSGLMRCNNRRPAGDYSITSSARPRSGGGTAMPSAFAVLRLMTNSNLVTWIKSALGQKRKCLASSFTMQLQLRPKATSNSARLDDMGPPDETDYAKSDKFCA